MTQSNQDNLTPENKVLAFDTLFTNNHIRMLKVLISHFDSRLQKTLAVYIKFQELAYTMQFLNKHSSFSLCGTEENAQPDISLLCDELIPYCAPSEKEKIFQIKQMLQTMDTYRQMSQMMEMMKDLFPEGFPSFTSNSEADKPEDTSCKTPFGSEMLSSLLGGENSQMFELLAAMMQNPQ